MSSVRAWVEDNWSLLVSGEFAEDFLPYREAKHPLLYGLAHVAVGQFLNHRYDLQVHGAENIPLSGPVVVAPKHSRTKDGTVAGVAVKRAMSYMSKGELWTDPRYEKKGIQLGPLLETLDAFPIDRDNASHDDFRVADDHLKKGKTVCVFPEGHRDDEVGKLHAGAATLAWRAHAPLLPMAIGNHRLNEGSEIVRVIVPPPLYADYSLRKWKSIEVLMDEYEATLRQHQARSLGWAAFDAAAKDKSW